MKKATILHPHTATYRDPIILRPGDEVTIGHEDTDNPGWVWCTDIRGRAGWVPKSILEYSFDGRSARGFENYDATELTVERGDVVTVIDEESGWLLCEDAGGQKGWVPKGSIS